MEDSAPAQEAPIARFSERAVAFAVDLFAVFGVYYALSVAVAVGAPAVITAAGGAWQLVFLFFFLAYHGFLAADGRTSLGKKLMGLRVVATDGADLSLGRSFARAAAYLLSSFGVGLGFLWALRSSRRAWHDGITGTTVVETRQLGAVARIATTAAAWGFSGLMAFLWMWFFIIGPRYAQMQLVANAQVGLQSLGRLQDAYKRGHGEYAPDLDSLLQATGHAAEFKEALPKIIDITTFKFEGSKDSFVVEGIALDEHKTMIRVRNAQ
jgi:uncharacterized RDD family membrane protein YckC